MRCRGCGKLIVIGGANIWRTIDLFPCDWSNLDCGDMDSENPGDRITGWHRPLARAEFVEELVGVLRVL
jgi:hypothetical protein